MYPGLLIPWVVYSYLGQFDTMVFLYHGQFVRWTVCTTDVSYYGLFVPYTNIPYATKRMYIYVCLSVLVFYLVYMYCTVISVVIYQRSLSRFHANKRVQSVVSFLPCWTQYFSTHAAGNRLSRNFFWMVCRAVDGCRLPLNTAN